VHLRFYPCSTTLAFSHFKVFRTYNASITLDRLLEEQEPNISSLATVDEKKALYDAANKEVAILCNHQRSAPKAHSDQMSKLQAVLDGMSKEIEELEEELKLAKKGKPGKDGKVLAVAQ
jgi:DNA topoisomerase-1